MIVKDIYLTNAFFILFLALLVSDKLFYLKFD